MDYEKILEYYLTSDEWKFEMDCFFEAWTHCLVLEDESTDTKQTLYSDIYLEYEKKMLAAGGCFFDLHLTEAQFKKYFNKRYCASQRFAVLFGLWWGLPEAQISHIADLRQRKRCSHWLNYFLCNPDALHPHLTENELISFSYYGPYHQLPT